jgi:tRNA pseudouridine55 synthase
MMTGFLNIYKPLGVSSAGILNTIKRTMGVKKIGHGGTLDPMAEGVLPVAIGRATRLLRFLPSDKRYRTTVLLGKRSDTDDLEGSVIGEGCSGIDESALQGALASQRGVISQMVPAYSAVHLNGKRLYKMARQGEAPLDLPVKEINIYSLELLASRPITYEGSSCWELSLDIHCSAGTYIRSIARDIGEALGCGGCMSSLQRTWASGMDSVEATSVDTLREQGVEAALIDPREVVDMELIEIDEKQWYELRTGRAVSVEHNATLLGCLYEEKLRAVIAPSGTQWRSEVVIA